MAAVLIQGEGIAASCCARLLIEAGLPFTVAPRPRLKLPAVMLSETTQKLLRDVFDRDDLFNGLLQIRKRVVMWGEVPRLTTLPHSAVVVSESELLTRIHQQLEYREDPNRAEPEWTVFASAPLPPPSTETHFGLRPAAASPVKLKRESDCETCWIESLESGWLFLLPTGTETGWLLSVGGPVDALVGMSRLIKEHIDGLGPSQGTFASHPRIASPLSEPGWLACGTAALAFDPLCGDGAGNAVREAILGAAMLGAIVNGFDLDSLIAHYHSRLIAGFERHVALCLQFYQSGGSGGWWADQAESCRRGLAWCSEQLSEKPPFRYRLNGFALEPAS